MPVWQTRRRRHNGATAALKPNVTAAIVSFAGYLQAMDAEQKEPGRTRKQTVVALRQRALQLLRRAGTKA